MNEARPGGYEGKGVNVCIVEWCDHEGNLHQREFQTLEDAKAEAEYLAQRFDGVEIKNRQATGQEGKMEYINIEKFIAFLEENLKQPFGYYDFTACLAHFERRIGETGSSEYELAPWETKSGRPETISFDREDRFLYDGQEVGPEDNWDDVETRTIF